MTSKEVIESFHRLYYGSLLDTWANTSWLGVATEKFPGDLFVYQEIVAELKPDFIIETGTRFGGSALFLATVCEAMGTGQVISIDLEELASSATCRPTHPRVTYVTGSSTAPGTFGHARALEDCNINGHPVAPDFGPGPWDAVEVFLKGAPEFSPDLAREKFLLTFNPRGYLRKNVADSAGQRLLTAQAQLADEAREVEELRTMLAEERAAKDQAFLELASIHEQSAEAQNRVDAAIVEAKHAAEEAARATEEAARATEEARGAIEESTAELAAVRRSASWRLTAPLRGLKSLFVRRA